MDTLIDPDIVELFGGRTRASVLGILANAGRPLTAYRVSRIAGAQLTKVGAELRRLERAAIARQVPPSEGGPGWIMIEPSLREMLRRRVRIVWLPDWDAQVGRRALRTRSGPRPRIDLNRYRPDPSAVPNRREFVRPPEKDRVLVAVGLPPSRSRRRRR